MNRLYQAAITYIGAHRIEQRGHHETDRANQRLVIACLLLIAAGWYGMFTHNRSPVVMALPFVAAVYMTLTLLYRKMIQARPDALVGAQYAFLVLDPALTVLAIATMPTVLGPLHPLLLVQIVRCGIRYGTRTLWLAWGAAAVFSALLLPLNPFWSLHQPLTQSFIAMLVITPVLFGPFITHLHRVSAELRLAATSDPLTGLGNRRMLAEHLRLAQERSLRDLSGLALILLDLDNFKAVNDTLGHGTGDHLLERVAAAVKANARNGDFLARIGGDEFVLLVEGLTHNDGAAQARHIGEAIIQTVQQTAAEVCPSVPVSASVGVHCWSYTDQPGANEVDLIARADRAMYAAKRAGKSRVVLSTAA